MTTFQEDLKLLRSQIDDVDERFLELLAHRVEISIAIARFKRANGLPIIDKTREAEMIAERVSAVMPLNLPEDWISDLFQTILKGCRTISHQRLDREHPGSASWLDSQPAIGTNLPSRSS